MIVKVVGNGRSTTKAKPSICSAIHGSMNRQTCLVWSGLVWSGLVWSGLVWSGLVWSGLVWSGLFAIVKEDTPRLHHVR